VENFHRDASLPVSSLSLRRFPALTQVNGPILRVVSVRQASAVLGVLGGILLFRERFGRIRLFGAALIALGIVCIKPG
jgi:drug/metabolite transporter (DMT)-like permease